MRHTVWLPNELEARVQRHLDGPQMGLDGPMPMSLLVRFALEEYLASREIASRSEGVGRVGIEQVERARAALDALRAALIRQAAARDSGRRNQGSLLAPATPKETT